MADRVHEIAERIHEKPTTVIRQLVRAGLDRRNTHPVDLVEPERSVDDPHGEAA
jgi:hypothetical protein